MILTTVLLYHVMRNRWQWSLRQAAAVTGILLAIDLVFFSANLLKILEGGWIPLTFGTLVFFIMTTWHSGVEAMRRRSLTRSLQPAEFFGRLRSDNVARVPGTAVFLTRFGNAIPPVIVNHVKQVGSVPKTVIALTVSFEDVPRVRSKDRVRMERLNDGFWHVTVHFGFVEIPDLPAVLKRAKRTGCRSWMMRAIILSATILSAANIVIRCRDGPLAIFIHVAQFCTRHRPLQDSLERAD
jgi:KUP system potassium uptake protein